MDSSSKWSQYFVPLKRIFYYIIIFLSVTFNIIDLQILEMHDYEIMLNRINLVVVGISFILFLLKKINLQWATGITMYFAIFNLIFSQFIGLNRPEFELYVFRNSMIFAATIPFIGFIINKIHSVIVGVGYLLAIALFIMINKSELLIENLPTLYLIMVPFVGANYFLLRLLENALYKQSEFIKKLSGQNTLLEQKSNELSLTNKLLSEQKQIVETQKQDLVEMNESKDTFFSIISHDLRAPFNAMLGLSDLMQDAFINKEYDRAEAYSRFISKSSRHGYYLLENLLEWSQTQTGRIKFKPFAFELKDLVNETTELLQENANRKEITIRTDIPPDGLLVYADRNMIFTVLRNLISNAIKYTTEFGTININASANHTECKVVVSDTGVGIKQENIGKLFEIDEHHTTSGTNNEKGTGLGLILCKEFVEKNKGKLIAESTLGKGSDFVFTIPLQAN